jgi:hypothetical protein
MSEEESWRIHVGGWRGGPPIARTINVRPVEHLVAALHCTVGKCIGGFAEPEADDVETS